VNCSQQPERVRALSLEINLRHDHLVLDVVGVSQNGVSVPLSYCLLLLAGSKLLSVVEYKTCSNL